MKQTDMMRVLKAVAPKKSTCPICEDLVVENGVAWVTDMDVWAAVPTDMADGVYRPIGRNLERYPDGQRDGSDRPIAPALDGAPIFAPIPFPREAFKAAVNFIGRPTAAKPARFSSVVCLRVKANQMEIAATDTFALARYVAARPSEIPDGDYLLPSKAIQALLVDKGADELTVSVTNNYLFMDTGTLRVIARKRESRYFNTDRIIPSGLDRVIGFNKKELQKAAKALIPYTNKEENCIELRPEDGGYTITARDKTRSLEKTILVRTLADDTGYAGCLLGILAQNLMVVTPMSLPEGRPPDGVLRIQPQYLTKVCASVTGPSVYMGLQGDLSKLKPVIFSGEHPSHGGDVI